MTKTIKIYAVTFNEYTNCMNDTVSDGNKEIGKKKFIDIGRGTFLIKESDIEFIRQYGNGIKTLTFVGNLADFI